MRKKHQPILFLIDGVANPFIWTTTSVADPDDHDALNRVAQAVCGTLQAHCSKVFNYFDEIYPYGKDAILSFSDAKTPTQTSRIEQIFDGSYGRAEFTAQMRNDAVLKNYIS